MSDAILKPEELLPAAELARKTLEQLDRILLGRTELHRLVLTGILARGHVLLEGLPGLGKTAPKLSDGDVAAGQGALDNTVASGGSAHAQVILPEHRQAVQQFFKREGK